MLARGAVQAGGEGSEGPGESSSLYGPTNGPTLASTPASGLPLFGEGESAVMTVDTTPHFYQELLETMEIGGCGGGGA